MEPMEKSETPGAWMQAEIETQAALLPSLAERYYDSLRGQLGRKSYDLVVLVARGSSDNVATYARYLIEIQLGIPVVLAAPSVWTVFKRFARYPDKTLVIGISQSGAGPDVSAILEEAQKVGCETLAITNVAGSRLTHYANITLNLEAGEERSVAATKTYTASLLAVFMLVRVLDPSLPFSLAELPTREWFDACREEAELRASSLLGTGPFFSVGRGFSFSTANEAAIKLMECALIPCHAYSSADFQHGPKALAGVGSVIVDFTTTLADSLRQPATFIVPPSPSRTVSDPLIPFWQIPFGQWLALSSARAKSLDPDHPQYIQKVTETT